MYEILDEEENIIAACRLGWSFSGNPAWAASNAGFSNPAYALIFNCGLEISFVVCSSKGLRYQKFVSIQAVTDTMNRKRCLAQ
jgi:hypothetical protein